MAEVDNKDAAELEENDAVEVIIEDDEGMDMENESDDDSGNSANEEEEKEQAVIVLEEKVLSSPYVYELHVELIKLLSELGDPHRLDKAYDRLNNWCALEPDQWLHRLHVIKTLTESDFNEENIKKAHGCFEKAIREVYNFQIYMLWLQFVMDLEVQDESKVLNGYEPRRIIAKALDMAGSDPLHGHEIWEKALVYEKQKFDQIGSESSDLEDQVHRVFDVYAGWLSKPLLENDNVMQQFDEFVLLQECIKEDDVKEVREDYEMAQAILQKILPFEEKLTMFGTTTKAVSLYTDYINNINELLLLGDLDESILKNLLPMLYDRATYECCSLSLHSSDESILSLCETLLADYAEFAKMRGGREYFDTVLDRIIKRWPKSCHFWIIRMREDERRTEGISKIKTTLELALSCGIGTPEDSVELWTAYLEAIKRLTDFSNEVQVERLRATFRLAWDSLGRTWGDRADPDCSILLFWARLEYKIIGDHKQGKELFEEVFECGMNKTRCNVWLELINMETRRVPLPPPHKITDLFKRALKFVADWPKGICDIWLNHERDHGTLNSLEDCNRTCKDILDEWDKKMEERKKARLKNTQSERIKPKFNQQQSNKSPKKVPEDSSGSELKRRSSVKDFQSSDSPRKQKRLMPPPPAPTSAPPAKKTRINEESELGDKNSRTVFVSNLGYTVDDNNLKAALNGFGDVEEIRIIPGVKAFGGSICYCVYKNKDSMETALRNDRTLLDDRPMFISLYSEDKSSRRPKFNYSTEAEKNKLFVKNLPFEECTNERLTEVFAPHGSLRDIRIVTRKDGKPKGLAYVEYDDEKSAATALKATNGLRLKDKEIIVALSAPPPKKSVPDSSLGGGRRDPTNATKGRGKGRTQLSAFIPRALLTGVALKQGNGVPGNNADSSQGASTKLSNADFRSMLLGKK